MKSFRRAKSIIGSSSILLSLAAAGCGGSDPTMDPSSEGATGEVQAALQAVPSAVKCIRFSATTTGGARTWLWTPASATSKSFSFGPVAPGAAQFRAEGFAAACADVTTSSVATWVTPEAVSVNVGAGVTTKLNIVLERSTPTVA